MTDQGLTNIFMLSMLQKCRLHRFKGVFSCDTIPKDIVKMKHFTLICNIDREDEPGSHYVAIIGQPHRIIYNDPLALNILNADISEFLETATLYGKRKLELKNRAVQHPLSLFCGFHAMLQVLFYDCDNHHFKIKYSRSDLWKNDIIVIRMIKKFFHLYTG